MDEFNEDFEDFLKKTFLENNTAREEFGMNLKERQALVKKLRSDLIMKIGITTLRGGKLGKLMKIREEKNKFKRDLNLIKFLNENPKFGEKFKKLMKDGKSYEELVEIEKESTEDLRVYKTNNLIQKIIKKGIIKKANLERLTSYCVFSGYHRKLFQLELHLAFKHVLTKSDDVYFRFLAMFGLNSLAVNNVNARYLHNYGFFEFVIPFILKKQTKEMKYCIAEYFFNMMLETRDLLKFWQKRDILNGLSIQEILLNRGYLSVKKIRLRIPHFIGHLNKVLPNTSTIVAMGSPFCRLLLFSFEVIDSPMFKISESFLKKLKGVLLSKDFMDYYKKEREIDANERIFSALYYVVVGNDKSYYIELRRQNVLKNKTTPFYNTVPSVVRVCGNCGKEENTEIKLKKCSKCKIMFYCDRVCQKRNWGEHKKNCKPSSN